jgi:phosphoglycerate dehydrogenase-like enzyme
MTTSTSPIVAFLVDAPIPQTLHDAVDRVAPGWRVVATPYVESTELRTSRGRNGGQNLEGIPAPEITDEMKTVWRDAVAMIVVDLPDNLEVLAPNLRWVQSATAGFDKYDLAAISRQGVQLSTASGVGSASIAEFVMGRLLQVWKNLRTFDEQQAEREWKAMFGTELTGRTIAIIGLGAIGRDVAKRAAAFGMRTVATRASATPGATDPDVDQLLPAAEMDEALAQADAVVAALPANPATHDLFNAERFAAMKPGAIFCNVGRGTHVVEADLIEALESGHLHAAPTEPNAGSAERSTA